MRLLAGWLERLLPSLQPVAELRQTLASVAARLHRIEGDLDTLRVRQSAYLGNGTALTWLADDTPILVNADDFGCPFNLLNGGRYEEDNVDVLLSFLRDDSVFLDIGANVGIHTLKVARRLGPAGRVHAFEPHPLLAELLFRNVHVNGLARQVACHRVAASDANGTARLQYPRGHLGGGQMGPQDRDYAGHTGLEAETRRLDDCLGEGFACDLVKIDVEGHEAAVLRGMREIVARSPAIKILFEKLLPEMGTEAPLEAYFAETGFVLYGVGPGAVLTPLAPGGLAAWGGYVLAARPGVVADGLDRSRFAIHAGQLLLPYSRAVPAGPLRSRGSGGELLFHGPYWYLRRGAWRLDLVGEVSGAVSLAIQERFGHRVAEFLLAPGATSHVFTADHDLLHFECAARAAGAHAEIAVTRLEFSRQA